MYRGTAPLPQATGGGPACTSAPIGGRFSSETSGSLADESGYILVMRRSIRIGLVALALSGVGSTLWLLRDPVPHIMKRRSTTLSVTTLVTSEDAAHRNERLRLRGANGLVFDLQVRAPVTASGATPRWPVFLILGGYRTGDRAATLIPDTRGNLVVAMSYPYEGDLAAKGLAVVPQVPAIRRAILDTPAAVMLAIDYLLSRRDVDSARIELVGASFGAPFGMMVGALDRRVTRVWSVHGAADPYAQIELNLRPRIGWAGARVPIALLGTLLVSGWQFDPARWAPRVAPTPLVMINARMDERMPTDAVARLHAVARAPSDVVWLDGPHMQSNRTAVIRGLVDTVLERASR